MCNRRLLAIVLLALLAAATASAAAEGAELKTNVSGLRIEGTTAAIEAVSTALSFKGGFGQTVCEVTLRGTLRTGLIALSTAGGTLTALGGVTEGRVRVCTTAGVTLLAETFPWSIGMLAGTTGALLEVGRLVGALWLTLGMNIRIKQPLSIDCLIANANVLFLYNNSGTLAVGGVSTPNLFECGFFGPVEIVGSWRVTPSTLRFTALLA